MEEFGVRFSAQSESDFGALQKLFAAIKADTDSEEPREEAGWLDFVPNHLKANFSWPSEIDRAAWIEFSRDKPIAIQEPHQQLSSIWDFYSIIDAFHNGDYELLRCEEAGESCEMHIYPFGYPYGGIGPLIALAEGFGFRVEGYNEYGKYLSVVELEAECKKSPKQEVMKSSYSSGLVRVKQFLLSLMKRE